jgi:hypothetical protein
VVFDQLGVPAQQGSGRDDPMQAQPTGEEPAQSTEQRSICPGEGRPQILAAKDGEFVAQDEDLGVLGGARSGEEREPAEHSEQRQLGQTERHDD